MPERALTRFSPIASAINGPTPECVINRTVTGLFSTSCSNAQRQFLDLRRQLIATCLVTRFGVPPSVLQQQRGGLAADMPSFPFQGECIPRLSTITGHTD